MQGVRVDCSNVVGVGLPSRHIASQDRAILALIDRHPHPNSRREIVVELTRRGRAVVDTVTARRRAEIARVVEVMPARDRMGMVRSLHAFTEAGGEPPADAPAGLDF